MKMTFHAIVLCGMIGGATAVSAADTRPISYEVAFNGAIVATQTVNIVQSGGSTTVSTAFEAELPVFIAMHHYSEQLSATFRTDGTVERLGAIRLDGGDRTSIAGTLQDDGLLQVVRTDLSGVSTNSIAREDYDFNSLILYGAAPSVFLTTNDPARVLQVPEGRVESVSIQTISESDTFERQHLVSTHLVWTAGIHVSHSWHPERFSDLPRRYVRQTENGEFTFTLLR
jgi:hypothetical protein